MHTDIKGYLRYKNTTAATANAREECAEIALGKKRKGYPLFLLTEEICLKAFGAFKIC